jgi:hypothetical protein
VNNIFVLKAVNIYFTKQRKMIYSEPAATLTLDDRFPAAKDEHNGI